MLKGLVFANLLASALHFLHNAVFLERYPGPPWIPGAWFVVALWFVLAAVLVRGYRWYRAGDSRRALVAIGLYCLSCILVFGHYLYGSPRELDALTNGLIVAEGVAGVTLLVYFVTVSRHSSEVAMRCFAPLAFLLLVPTPGWAWQTAPLDAPPAPTVSVVGGLGNTMAGLGGQVQAYLAGGRVGVFGGLGYMPEIESGDWSGMSVAGGVRGYTGARRHRGYLELSASPMQMLTGCFDSCERFYGIGMQAGYQLLTSGGFTFVASLGVGYTLGIEDGTSRVSPLGDLGIGYTWRR